MMTPALQHKLQQIDIDRVVVLDFETFYSADFSLTFMPTQEYIQAPEFETIGVGISIDFAYPCWYPGLDAGSALEALDLGRKGTLVVAHNAMFDGGILEFQYGIRPWMYLCTMMGARPNLVPKTPGNRMSLSSLAMHVNAGAKQGYVVQAKGKRLCDFSTQELSDYGDYCIQDVNICAQLAESIILELPPSELRLLDQTVKQFTRPKIMFDRKVLAEEIMHLRRAKQDAMEKAGIKFPTQLRSNDQFAVALQRLGVRPPKKVSPTTGKETWAFAKTDEDFKALQEHDDPLVQALCAARLQLKSTQAETRAARFLMLARLGTKVGAPLLYYGAHTGRYSGCLTGDTYVTVLRDGSVLRRELQDVLDTDLVWDGEEFVNHEGVVFSGFQSVIEYRGIIGTPNHPVLTRDGRGYIGLAEAAEGEHDLAIGAAPDANRVHSTVFRAGDYKVASGSDVQPMQQGSNRPSARRPQLTTRPLQELCNEAAHEWGRCPHESHPRSRQNGACAVSERPLRDDRRAMEDATRVGAGGEATLHQPKVCRLLQLWGQGDRVSVRQSERSNRMGVAELGASPRGHEHRPHQQRGTLRAGESSVRYEAAAEREPTRLQGLAPTFDLLNCGPRHRFVANGYVVHNSDKLNLQNLPRGSALRRAITAPPGHVLVAGDLSQIEVRVLAWLADETDLIDIFLLDRDPYVAFAARLYGVHESRVTKEQRRVAKSAVLGLGYGMGADRFRDYLLAMGITDVDEEACERTVKVYRATYGKIRYLWQRASSQWMPTIIGQSTRRTYRYKGGLVFAPGFIGLPNGMALRYPKIEIDPITREWTYGEQHRRIYGPKLVENGVQALARIVMTRAQLWLAERGVPAAFSVHDELIYVVREDYVEKMVRALDHALTRPVPWMKLRGSRHSETMPVACEVKTGVNYGELKEWS